jgi:hypothetical protein
VTSERSKDYLVILLNKLCGLPLDCEQDEFKAGATVPADPGAAPKLMRCLPFWASAPREGQA